MTDAAHRICALVVVAACAVSMVGLAHGADSGDRLVLAPPPAVDGVPSPGSHDLARAVLAGGCFWGLQGVFQHVVGVKSVVAGYDGGVAGTATYEQVGTGTTGHAEAVEITYDPSLVSYGQLLQVYFDAATDPTQADRQFPDTGTQYRGEIFATSPAQGDVARAYLKQISASHAYSVPLATVVGTDTGFFRAERHHQNYLLQHPDQPYIVTYDMPKLSVLKETLPALWTDHPARASPND